MVRRPKGGLTATSAKFSFADAYIDDLRKPKYVYIRTKFPLIEDRGFNNIDYTSEELRRSWRAQPHRQQDPMDKLTFRGYQDLSWAEYKFFSNVADGNHIPANYLGTISGIEPWPENYVPFQYGPARDADSIFVVSGKTDPVHSGGAAFFIERNIDRQVKLFEYTPTYDAKVGRFYWLTEPEYETPTQPEVRYPGGVRRRKFFKYS